MTHDEMVEMLKADGIDPTGWVLGKKQPFSLRFWLVRKLIGVRPVLANWIIREKASLLHSGKGGMMVFGNHVDAVNYNGNVEISMDH